MSLGPAVRTDGKAAQRLFHLVFESHDGRARVPIPKRSTSPRATSTLGVVDSLKVLDPKWPIREADIIVRRNEVTLRAKHQTSHQPVGGRRSKTPGLTRLLCA